MTTKKSCKLEHAKICTVDDIKAGLREQHPSLEFISESNWISQSAIFLTVAIPLSFNHILTLLIDNKTGSYSLFWD